MKPFVDRLPTPRRRAGLAALLLFAAAAASAEVCCPAGCVQDGARCVRTGPTPTACAPAACPARPGGGGGAGGSGRGAPVWSPILPVRPPGRVCTLKGDRPPPGSYRKTCNDIAFRCSQKEDSLTAICRSGHGLVKSTLPSASTCAEVENRDGRLVCRKQRRYVTEG